MKCPHCGFAFEDLTHCPNCGKAPGKPGRTKVYYDESAVTQQVQPMKQPEQAVLVEKEPPKPEPKKTAEKTPAPTTQKKKKKSILFPLLIAAFFLYMTPGNPITMLIAAYCGLLVIIRIFSRLSARSQKSTSS